MDQYHFYILYSSKLDKYYVGHTVNLKERLKKHNTNHSGYTGKANDWEVVFLQAFHSKEGAYKRELEVKKWKSRKRIERLIGSEHPDF